MPSTVLEATFFNIPPIISLLRGSALNLLLKCLIKSLVVIALPRKKVIISLSCNNWPSFALGGGVAETEEGSGDSILTLTFLLSDVPLSSESLLGLLIEADEFGLEDLLGKCDDGLEYGLVALLATV